MPQDWGKDAYGQPIPAPEWYGQPFPICSSADQKLLGSLALEKGSLVEVPLERKGIYLALPANCELLLGRADPNHPANPEFANLRFQGAGLAMSREQLVLVYKPIELSREGKPIRESLQLAMKPGNWPVVMIERDASGSFRSMAIFRSDPENQADRFYFNPFSQRLIGISLILPDTPKEGPLINGEGMISSGVMVSFYEIGRWRSRTCIGLEIKPPDEQAASLYNKAIGMGRILTPGRLYPPVQPKIK